MSDVRLGGTGESKWDFAAKRLEQNVDSQDFAGSESTLILATPDPYYSQNAVNQARAIALIQSFGYNQSRQATQMYEVGSRRKYTFSSGRIRGQLTLGRTIFDGESLLKTVSGSNVTLNDGDGNAANAGDPDSVGDYAGYGDFFINLGASLFSRPIGIIMVMRDVGNENIGAAFFQETYVTSHRMNISSRNPFVSESCQLLYEGVFPLQHKAGATANAANS